MSRMDFYVGDAYPNFVAGTGETGFLAQPDAEQQEALAENENVSTEADMTTSRPKLIFLAIGLIILLVIFFGAGE